jgi:2'-5' RNA ligase
MDSMQLSQFYDALWSESRSGLLGGLCQPDALIEAADDSRRGISVIGRLEPAVVSQICRFTEQCREVEPRQYFYPAPEIHFTVMSIITCREGFTLDAIDVGSYAALIGKAVARSRPFEIHFRGITASPACIMIQGFPQDDTLERLRDGLRQGFKSSPLEHTIDARYSIRTAHSTVIRFSRPLADPPRLVGLLDSFRAHDFGRCRLTRLQLVFNDWYHRRQRCELLSSFTLG